MKIITGIYRKEHSYRVGNSQLSILHQIREKYFVESSNSILADVHTINTYYSENSWAICTNGLNDYGLEPLYKIVENPLLIHLP